MITAIYYRVSTDEQKIDSQTGPVERYLRAHEIENVRIFQDHFTGSSMDRPGWNQLEGLIDNGQVERLIIYSMDRLGRTATGLVTLFDKLSKQGVNLVSIKENFDLATPAGRLLANIMASVAAYDNENRRVRIMDGIKAAQKYLCKGCDSILTGKNGECPLCGSKQVVKLKETAERWKGRPKGSLGKKSKEKLAVILKLQAAGISQVNIAKLTGISRPTVCRLLKENPPS